MKPLNEEDRALVATVMWLAVQCSRRSIAGWTLKRPHKIEMENAMRTLHAIEDSCERLAKGAIGRDKVEACLGWLKEWREEIDTECQKSDLRR